MLSSVQNNVSFGNLHIAKEDRAVLNTLMKKDKDVETFKEACAKINKESGTRDVYLRTGDVSPIGYVPVTVEYNGDTVCSELCNSNFIDNYGQFKSLADNFAFNFNYDVRYEDNSKNQSKSSAQDVFDIYA